jgi:hypothetical protein
VGAAGSVLLLRARRLTRAELGPSRYRLRAGNSLGTSLLALD